MAPVKFVSLEDFHARRLLPGESLSVFVHQLKQMLTQAMPTVNTETREQLLLHQVVTGLPSHVSKQLWAVGELNKLDKVLESEASSNLRGAGEVSGHSDNQQPP